MTQKRSVKITSAKLFMAIFCVLLPASLFAQTPPARKIDTAAEKRRKQADLLKHWKQFGRTGKSEPANKTKTNAKGNAGSDSKANGKTAGDKPGGGTGRVKLKNPGPSKVSPGTKAGDPTKKAAPLLGDERPSFVVSILQFLGVMALMLGGFYYGVRFLKSRGANLGGTSDLVRVIASVPLLQGKFLQIVDMAGKLLVLGVSDHGVNLISVIEDARTADQIRIWDSRRGVGAVPAGLMEQLTRVIKGSEYRFWGRGDEKEAQKPDFQELLRGRGGVMPETAGAGAGFGVGTPTPTPTEARTPAPTMDTPIPTPAPTPVAAPAQNMLFNDASPAPDNHQDQEETVNQADLERLLTAQKRKLAAMKGRGNKK